MPVSVPAVAQSNNRYRIEGLTMKPQQLNKITLGLVIAGGLFHSQAFAQQAPAAAEEEPEYEQIMVTANRTATAAEKTPVALSVLGTQQLRDQGITNPTQLAETVPNVSIDRTNGLQITIRGVTSTDNTEKGDPSAAFMLDGIYIARPQAQEVSFFDIDRVEVLRGPQGTLYGRNTTAGLVNVISAKPHEFFEASADMTLGNYNTRQFTGIVNMPVNDSVSFRAAVNIDQRDNYVEYEAFDGTEAVDISDFKDNRSIRLSGLFNFTEDMTLLVRGDYSQMKGNNMASVPVHNFFETPFTDPSTTENGEGVSPVYVNRGTDNQQTLAAGYFPDVYADNSTWGVMGDFTWLLNDALTFNYLGSYREFDRDEMLPLLLGGDAASKTDYWVDGPFSGTYEQQSHEFRIAYNSDKWLAQAGLYYFEEQSGIRLDIIGLINPTPGEDGYIFGFPQNPTKADSLGFFSQATYNVSDDLRLTAGIRTTKDQKSRAGATIFHKNLGEELNFQASDDNPLPDSLNYADREYSKTTWKLGVDYDISDATMLYGSIATGYKAGGFNDGCVEGATGCNSPLPEAAVYYDPETLTSTELGIKTRVLNNKMTINANVFSYDYQDLQLSQLSYVCGGPCQVTTNAAEATINGAELDTFYRPNVNHRFNAAVTLLDASYDEWILDEEAGVSFAGERLSRSPEWTVTAGYQYTMEMQSGGELSFALNTRWSAEYEILSSALRANFRQPGFTKTDLTMTYNSPDRDWYAQAFVKNLENNITLSNVGPSGDFNTGTATFADPRLVGVRFGYKFQ